MNKSFIDFLKEVKEKLPNAVDEEIIQEIAKCGFGEDIDSFIAKFKAVNASKVEPTARPTKVETFSDKLLASTLAMTDVECIRMLCNMVYFNSNGNKMFSVLNLKRNDDFEIVRNAIGIDATKDIIKSALKDPSKCYCVLLTEEERPYILIGAEDIKKAIKDTWESAIFPMVMAAPERFEYLSGHDTDCRYYEDIVTPQLCKEFGVSYNG